MKKMLKFILVGMAVFLIVLAVLWIMFQPTTNDKMFSCLVAVAGLMGMVAALQSMFGDSHRDEVRSPLDRLWVALGAFILWTCAGFVVLWVSLLISMSSGPPVNIFAGDTVEVHHWLLGGYVSPGLVLALPFLVGLLAGVEAAVRYRS